MARIGLINLGCPRNLLDSEVMLGLLKKQGYTITEDFNACDAAVVNTCAFIEDAKKESIDVLLQLINLKQQGRIKSIVVTGCLPQRYHSDLKKELKEIDGFLGTDDFISISSVLQKTLAGKPFTGAFKSPTFLYDHTYPRELITPSHFVYIKLSEGCNNKCSYCVIPTIRGSLRSRKLNSVVSEVKGLSRKHAISEVNLIGQDITLYGYDLYKKPQLEKLIKALLKIKKSWWIRLLYTHPAHYTNGLIQTIKHEPSICKYLDLPLQHINDRILRLMNRKTKKDQIRKLIERLRKEIPGLALRTTFIAGFPGETDKEYRELVNFIKEIRFERLGVFEYSREEGTPAYGFKGQVPDNVKKARREEIMQVQQQVAKEVNARFLGKELKILIEEPVAPGKTDHPDEPYSYIGRTEYDAPEVDGNCFVKTTKKHKPGEFVKAKIVDTLEYDLVGEEL